jgi:hypothetical protein
MDEMNVHQFWGISPFIDLLATTSAVAGQATAGLQQQHGTDGEPLRLLQVRLAGFCHTVTSLRV